tara:strand:- start:367 stop:729 length:363 start_codon:yes stop_codon:yes gene_type:complete
MFKKKKPFRKKPAKKPTGPAPDQPIRVRTPREGQVLGVVDQRLGASRMKVSCIDGKNRICKIPGKLTRSLWVREGNTVLVEPWEYGGDEKGNIIYKYSQAQVQWLRNKGYLKEVTDLEEF